MKMPEVPPGTVIVGPSKLLGRGIGRWIAGPDDTSFGEILADNGTWVRDDRLDMSQIGKGLGVDDEDIQNYLDRITR
jgi:hypothetical protein